MIERMTAHDMKRFLKANGKLFRSPENNCAYFTCRRAAHCEWCQYAIDLEVSMA